MHELSIATAVLRTALKHADDRSVEVVAMRVGTLRLVVPDSLRFYWEIVARDTVCGDALLELAVIEARLRCGDCTHEWEPDIPTYRCPHCGSAAVTIVVGEELEIDYLELKEPVDA